MTDSKKTSSRQNRLKDNLRANLQKRKNQTRARTAEPAKTDNDDQTKQNKH